MKVHVMWVDCVTVEADTYEEVIEKARIHVETPGNRMAGGVIVVDSEWIKSPEETVAQFQFKFQHLILPFLRKQLEKTDEPIQGVDSWEDV